jgi:hypothetical protein
MAAVGTTLFQRGSERKESIMAKIIVEHYQDGVCDLRDEETGRRWRSPCEPTGRTKRQENQKTKEVFMQTETFDNAGQELDHKVKLHAAQHNLSYEAALQQVKTLEPDLYRAYVFDVTPLDRKVRDGAEEFSRRVVAYQDEWNLSRDEAKRRVAAHDPAMKCYEQDPYGPVRVVGIQEPLQTTDWTVTQMAPGEIHVTALMQISVLLGGLPRNADMSISFDAAARVLQAGYLDLLIRAAGEKMDYYARAEISILGLPGFSSENYRIGFDSARRKYPALTQIYSGGRISMQGLKELLPHLQLTN